MCTGKAFRISQIRAQKAGIKTPTPLSVQLATFMAHS
ncbi:MAG: hypothetical protein ABFS56_13960 [Pseudomonadota bacterium]